jgi:hypothetical protein
MLLLAVLSVTAASEAAAAVRYCRAPIIGEAQDKNEQKARRDAVERWQAGARELGEAWASWRLATPHTVRCTKVSEGYFCVAAASPCAITQNPDRPPPAGGRNI